MIRQDTMLSLVAPLPPHFPPLPSSPPSPSHPLGVSAMMIITDKNAITTV